MPTDTGIYTQHDAEIGHLFSAKLCNQLVQIIDKSSLILDFGCGPGKYIEEFKKFGFNAMGVEGFPMSEHNDLNIIHQDLAKPFDLNLKGTVLSLEVGEHIPSEFQNIFLNNIEQHCLKTIILSWAVVGQGGVGHVNCQNNEYIITEMNTRGFKYDEETSHILRSDVEDQCNYFRNTLMVFHRND